MAPTWDVPVLFVFLFVGGDIEKPRLVKTCTCPLDSQLDVPSALQCTLRVLGSGVILVKTNTDLPLTV